MKRYTILLDGSSGQVQYRRRIVVAAVDEGDALDQVGDRASVMFPGHFRMIVESAEELEGNPSAGVISSTLSS